MDIELIYDCINETNCSMITILFYYYFRKQNVDQQQAYIMALECAVRFLNPNSQPVNVFELIDEFMCDYEEEEI